MLLYNLPNGELVLAITSEKDTSIFKYELMSSLIAFLFVVVYYRHKTTNCKEMNLPKENSPVV